MSDFTYYVPAAGRYSIVLGGIPVNEDRLATVAYNNDVTYYINDGDKWYNVPLATYKLVYLVRKLVHGR